MHLVPCPPFNNQTLTASMNDSARTDQVVNVTCNHNYVEVGSNVSSVTCQDDGSWTEFPNCHGKEEFDTGVEESGKWQMNGIKHRIIIEQREKIKRE